MRRLSFALLLLVACGDDPLPPVTIDASVAQPGDPATSRPRGAGPPATTPPPEARRPDFAPPRAGEEIGIPAGVVRAGSLPGTVGRRPRYEADLIPVEVPGFAIDRLPYPNDPTEAPHTAVTRAEAASLCAEDGKRLCSELEWERACEADSAIPFPAGSQFDPEACGLDPLACASPFGVLDLGVSIFEWTESDVSRDLGSEAYSASVRGGRPQDAAPEHRCAARHAWAPDDPDRHLGFRCCRGPAPELTYPEEEARRLFRVLEIENEELRRIMSTLPELAPYAEGFSRFDAVDVDRALGRNGRTRDDVSWGLLDSGVLRWAPEPGEHAWVFAGSGAESSLVAVVYPMPDGSFVHGASFVLLDEEAPIALAFDPGSRREILWSACWGCAGEGGSIVYRDDDRRIVVLTQ